MIRKAHDGFEVVNNLLKSSNFATSLNNLLFYCLKRVNKVYTIKENE